ncbi:hypothetical protein AX774_g3255 [Zancudomyces culisetae]|uniref:Uncharacterized protein n=1 Tax=Zancudomyces culisetae TaxID=1213189 RepID=A0A1R1PQH0_ZANCU|nr:hypothetical protein AX774_g3255 [Zancudomyces culisetae]|eukprot:OMH83236.1 hypothetical protein AX774_g3255 [Zancudomyces culisetae]
MVHLSLLSSALVSKTSISPVFSPTHITWLLIRAVLVIFIVIASAFRFSPTRALPITRIICFTSLLRVFTATKQPFSNPTHTSPLFFFTSPTFLFPYSIVTIAPAVPFPFRSSTTIPMSITLSSSAFPWSFSLFTIFSEVRSPRILYTYSLSPDPIHNSSSTKHIRLVAIGLFCPPSTTLFSGYCSNTSYICIILCNSTTSYIPRSTCVYIGHPSSPSPSTHAARPVFAKVLAFLNIDNFVYSYYTAIFNHTTDDLPLVSVAALSYTTSKSCKPALPNLFFAPSIDFGPNTGGLLLNPTHSTSIICPLFGFMSTLRSLNSSLRYFLSTDGYLEELDPLLSPYNISLAGIVFFL